MQQQGHERLCLRQRCLKAHARNRYWEAQRDCARDNNVVRLIALATTKLRGLERLCSRRLWGKVYCSSRDNNGEIACANTTPRVLLLWKQQSRKRSCLHHQCCETQRDRACKDDAARLSLQQQGCKDWRNRAGDDDVEHTAANVIIAIIIVVVIVIVGPCHGNRKAQALPLQRVCARGFARERVCAQVFARELPYRTL